jgi:Lar family restriction alleviation protein
MSELKPCPFCGGEADRSCDELGGVDGDWIFCQDCGHGIQQWETETIEDVIKNWNTRPLEDAQAEIIKALKEDGERLDLYVSHKDYCDYRNDVHTCTCGMWKVEDDHKALMQKIGKE